MFLCSRTPFVAFATLCIASQVACSSPGATSTSDDLIAAEDTVIADVLTADGGTDATVTNDVAVADADGGTTDALLPDAADDAALDAAVDAAVDAAADAAADAAVDAAPDAPGDATTVDAATDTVSTPDSGAPGSDAVEASPDVDVDVDAGSDTVVVCDPAACPENACQSALCKSDGTCGLGPVKPCDDGELCTDDSCDVTAGCVYAPNQVTCTDGDACTTLDACVGGACVGSEPVVCSASDGCHIAGVCDSATGTCSSPVAADGTWCDDGNSCTGGDDACLAGVCAPGTALACAASDMCHVSLGCDPASGCLGETPITCSASDECHEPGICYTGGTTDPQGNVPPPGCTNPPKADSALCEDGNPCTVQDQCQSGTCTAGYPLACEASDPCHLPGVCLPATGACSNPIGPDGAGCSDGVACSLNDTCVGGKCMGEGACEEYQTWATHCYDQYGNELNAATGPPDAVDTCGDVGIVGNSYFEPEITIDLEFGYASTEFNTVTVRETCGGGVYKLELRDANYNLNEVWFGTDPTPYAVGDFRITFAPPGYPITGARITMTSNAAFGLDAVSIGFVKQPCTDYSYVGGCGCQVVPAANGSACSDGNACTANDTCQSGQCTSGATYLCDDKNDCTADACSGTGTCTHAPVQGECQPDGYGTYGVDVVQGAPTPQLGTPGSFSTLQTGNCPAGSVAVGFSGLAWQYLDQLRLDCAPLAPDGTLGAVTSTGNFGSSNKGDLGGTHCPEGWLLAGIDGTFTQYSDDLVAVSGRCLYPLDFPNFYSAFPSYGWAESTVTDAGSPYTVPNALGGLYALNAKEQKSLTCPAGSVITGIWGYAGVHPQTIGAICSPITTVCAAAPQIGCSDGDACTSGDVCSGGACQPSGPTNCDDGYPFTLDSCDKTAGCVHTAGPSLKVTQVCTSAAEGSPLTVSCPAGGYIANIAFAAYGSATGQCPTFTAGACDAVGEAAYLTGQCLGKSTCATTGWQTLNKNWSATNDPCAGATKSIKAVFECWSEDFCKDGIQNGDESAIDCGGSVCAGCKPGQACNSTADCSNSYCGLKDKVCQ
jgi:hypothetical protein